MNRFATVLAATAVAAAFLVPAVSFAATPNWNVTGSYVFTFNLGSDYPHDVSLMQDGSGNLTGGGGYPAGGPHVYDWALTSGSVSGDTIDFTVNYTAGADALTPLTTMHVVGTIVSGGTMSGTWTDNYQGGSRSGTWTSTSGTATPIPQCSSDDTTFDTFALGSVNGQHGWSSTGSFDQAIVNNTYGYPTFGCKSLRFSDAVTSGSFGDQTFSYSTANEAGETGTTNNGQSGGVRQNHFEAQFDLASAMSTLQPGMHLSVSPDRGDGARMSYLRFEDQTDGIHVFFDDVTDAGPLPTVANFNESDIATISRAPHTIKFVMDFVNGPSNDIVKIYIDGSLVKTGTSWEDYYRYDPEQTGSGNEVPTVDSLLFRESGTANASDAGKGFLVDNLTVTTSTTAPAAPASCPVGTVAGTPVTLLVNSNSSTPVMSSVLPAGTYLVTSSGTWANGGINVADTAYASLDNWNTVTQGYHTSPYFLGTGEFQLMINGSFVNWGSYNTNHTYSTVYTSAGGPAGFMVFDGNSNQGASAFNTGWYGDNNGSLSVSIAPCVVPPPKMVKVQIFKYVDNAPATAAGTNSAVFPMETTFTSPNLGNYTNTPFTLSPTGWSGIGGPYEADFIGSVAGANYEADEVTNAIVPNTTPVGASCSDGKKYALVGYSVGDTLSDALSATKSLTPPQFTNLQSDHVMIVWNKTCQQHVHVTIAKYIDGVHATAVNAGNATFSQQATYNFTNEAFPGGISGSDPYDIGPVGNNTTTPYEAQTLEFYTGASYSTHENVPASNVGATCAAGKPYALAGYSSGATEAAAKVATVSLTPPSFPNLQSNQFVIVWNTKCPTTGTISGMKFNDLNRNGKKDTNEPGLQGWTIKLENAATDAVIATTVTDASGNYTFANILPGTYEVREKHQKGWKRMSKNPKDIVIVAGSTVTDVNFGNAQTKKGENEDNDNDDQRHDQSGKFNAHSGRNNYDN